MARDRDYADLLEEVKGKKVMIWTCNTCARLCYNMGGDASVQRLAERLQEDGVEIAGTGSTSAGCMISKVKKKLPETDADLILALTCGIGARCVLDVSGKDVLNPVRTYGIGYMDEADDPVLVATDGSGGEAPLNLVIDPDDAPFI